MVQKKQVFSKPFNLVIEKKYPSLLIGPGIFEKKEDVILNDPKKWIFEKKYKIENIRRKQIFAYKDYLKKEATFKKKEIEDIQWLVKSKKETELEINLNKKQNYLKDSIIGLNNKANNFEKIKIVENIKVEKYIDKITSDSQLKANEAIIELYKKTKDVYKIEQLLSMGLLGLKKNRVFVPTRWSITSIDEALAKNDFNEIKNSPKIDSIKFFKYTFYDNIFYIFLIPGPWKFEMIETIEKQIVSQDFEFNNLRKDYAYNVTGAYYAARQVVLEKLKKINRSACVLIVREISKDYKSKGVWVIRESVFNAFEKENNLSDILEIINFLEKEKLSEIVKRSEILKNIRFQKSIFDF